MNRLTYNRIKEFLAKKRKKNVDLARYMKVDPQTVSGWCRNINQPEYPTLFKISEFLEVEAGDLLTLRKDLKEVEIKKGKKKLPTSAKKMKRK
jgi:transcriptional regulator with XRE-family HTH domain